MAKRCYLCAYGVPSPSKSAMSQASAVNWAAVGLTTKQAVSPWLLQRSHNLLRTETMILVPFA